MIQALHLPCKSRSVSAVAEAAEADPMQKFYHRKARINEAVNIYIEI